MSKEYFSHYILNNFPFEIGLTGNKCQTILSAVFSSVFKISQCWYLKPEHWDIEKYSTGAKEFKLVKIYSE